MVLPLRQLVFTGMVFVVSAVSAGHAIAQPASQANTPRPAFCIVNGLEGLPVTVDVTAGKAATKIRIPAGQHACCVKFCAENPAPSGYQISLQAQPAGAKAQPLCKASLTAGKILRVTGDPAQARCDEGRL